MTTYRKVEKTQAPFTTPWERPTVNDAPPNVYERARQTSMNTEIGLAEVQDMVRSLSTTTLWAIVKKQITSPNDAYIVTKAKEELSRRAFATGTRIVGL